MKIELIVETCMTKTFIHGDFSSPVFGPSKDWGGNLTNDWKQLSVCSSDLSFISSKVSLVQSKWSHKQQGPTEQHRELCCVTWPLNGSGVCGRMDTCICMAQSLCCPAKTVTTLLSPISQHKIKKKLKDPSLAQMLLFCFPPFLGRSWFAKNYTVLSQVEEGTDQFLILGFWFMLHCEHYYLLGQAWRQR